MATPGTGDTAVEPTAATGGHSSRWVWVSAVLAVIAVGLGIWALTLKSDLDSTKQAADATKQDLEATKHELSTTKQQLSTAQQDVKDLEASKTRQRVASGVALVTAKAVYDEFSKQLGATNAELETTQQEVKDANDAAAKADKDAAAAKQDAADAKNATDKAKAEASQAKAESQATQSKAAAAKGCAKAYIEAFGGLFDKGGANADAVRNELKSVTADCKDALTSA